MIDAQNIAFADRGAYHGDADFEDVPVAGLLSRDYALARQRQFMVLGAGLAVPVPFGSPPSTLPLQPCPPDDSNLNKSSTTHYTVIDKSRNVVSWTTTIEENLYVAVSVCRRERGS